MVELIGFLAGGLTTVSFVPQVIKTFRTKRCDDLSLGMLLAFTGGVVCWLVYGLLLWSRPIIVANTITLSLLVAMLGMKLVYGRATPQAGD